MNYFEVFVTLLIGVGVGLYLGVKFGTWFTLHELGSKFYMKLQTERNTAYDMAGEAVALGKHWKERALVAEAKLKEEEFDSWIAG